MAWEQVARCHPLLQIPVGQDGEFAEMTNKRR